MGRELRMVPPDWEHPRVPCAHRPACSSGQCYQPLHDETFAEAVAEWKRRFLAWESGTDPGQTKHPELEFWEWHGNPPDREVYRQRTWTPEEATCVQLYETVSEGTPLSPVCRTKEELVQYLMRHGDVWDQKPWSEAAARRMVDTGYAPSLMVMHNADGVTIQEPRDME